MDLFENTVLCKNCGKKMKQVFLVKNGFRLRALKCPSCSNHLIHPSDIEEYNRFNSLKNRQFHVKLRVVGNSYTVSIPREIINFMQEGETEMENVHQRMREQMKDHMQIMEKMVTLALQDSNKISLLFPEQNTENAEKPKTKNNEIRFDKVGGIKIKKEK